VFEFYSRDARAQAEIRAPLFEDKVVDFIAELAKVTDRRWTAKRCSRPRRSRGKAEDKRVTQAFQTPWLLSGRQGIASSGISSTCYY